MSNILKICMLVLSIFASTRAEFQEIASQNLELQDEKDNDVEMQDLGYIEMPILRGHRYPHCKVRYQACKVIVNDKCKCKKLFHCCENCFRRGVFCRALPEVCYWLNLTCQCKCLKDASNRAQICQA